MARLDQTVDTRQTFFLFIYCFYFVFFTTVVTLYIYIYIVEKKTIDLCFFLFVTVFNLFFSIFHFFKLCKLFKLNFFKICLSDGLVFCAVWCVRH